MALEIVTRRSIDNYVTFDVDGTLFRVLESDLSKYSGNILYKMYNDNKEHNTPIIVITDKDIFAIIINYLRGLPIFTHSFLENEYLVRGVYDESLKFQLLELSCKMKEIIDINDNNDAEEWIETIQGVIPVAKLIGEPFLKKYNKDMTQLTILLDAVTRLDSKDDKVRKVIKNIFGWSSGSTKGYRELCKYYFEEIIKVTKEQGTSEDVELTKIAYSEFFPAEEGPTLEEISGTTNVVPVVKEVVQEVKTEEKYLSGKELLSILNGKDEVPKYDEKQTIIKIPETVTKDTQEITKIKLRDDDKSLELKDIDKDIEELNDMMKSGNIFEDIPSIHSMPEYPDVHKGLLSQQKHKISIDDSSDDEEDAQIVNTIAKHMRDRHDSDDET